MHIAFATQPLRAICESQLKAERVLGVGEAADLRTVLSMIETAAHLAELLTIYGISAPTGGAVTIIENALQVQVTSNHRKLTFDDDGQLKATEITRIRIEAVGDYS